jgi:hypothetical protein
MSARCDWSTAYYLWKSRDRPELSLTLLDKLIKSRLKVPTKNIARLQGSTGKGKITGKGICITGLIYTRPTDYTRPLDGLLLQSNVNKAHRTKKGRSLGVYQSVCVFVSLDERALLLSHGLLPAKRVDIAYDWPRSMGKPKGRLIDTTKKLALVGKLFMDKNLDKGKQIS